MPIEYIVADHEVLVEEDGRTARFNTKEEAEAVVEHLEKQHHKRWCFWHLPKYAIRILKIK
jgi:hypothetical protein